MGEKSRGNWNIPWCSETKCTNRGNKCSKCHRKSLKKVHKDTYSASKGVGVGLGKGHIYDDYNYTS